MALEIGIVVGIYGLPFNQAININYDICTLASSFSFGHSSRILQRIRFALKAFLRQLVPKFNFGFLSSMVFITFCLRQFALLISPQAIGGGL